jgi:hypothetical protein
MSRLEQEIKNIIRDEIILELEINFDHNFERFLSKRYSINLDQLDEIMKETFPEKLI